ncbi:GNAT family N-acetyltransferase [Inquilinus sp. KBS0705]|nr:GNAT family N-acetyltransferase [Inquilinus sp. KBS0705]
MLIRDFSENDRDRLRRIYLDSRRATFHWLDTKAYKPDDFDADTEEERIIVAVNDKDEVLGFVSIYLANNFIHHLYIIPGLERQGIGKALLGAAVTLFDLPVKLKCLKRNENALGFYKANGWRIQAEGTDTNGEYYLLTNW